MQQNNKSKNAENVTGIWLLVILIFLLVWDKNHSKKKFFKHKLVSAYKVNKKTFSKWVKHFCDSNVLPYSEYVKSKKLTDFQVTYIWVCLGNPQSPIFSKADIIETTEGSYRSLRECIRKNPHKFGLTYKAYEELSHFPPAVANHIIKEY